MTSEPGPDLPLTLPWWFGVALFVAWLVVMALILRVARHWWVLRAERRRPPIVDRRPAPETEPPALHPGERRELPPGDR